jgi:nucleoside diphosphate kinase
MRRILGCRRARFNALLEHRRARETSTDGERPRTPSQAKFGKCCYSGDVQETDSQRSINADEALASGKVCLVVFLPDAVRGRLVEAIELWLRERTGCVPVARGWVSYTEEALDRFYPGVAARFPEGWPLFAGLFATGPCLATLWSGADVSRVIPSVKGATHPARCSGSTIRGRFWCDNPTANLVHVSDDGAAAVRQLQVLRSLEPELFGGQVPMQALAPFRESGPATPGHSAILTLCSLVTAHLSSQGSAVPRLQVPESGDARETMARCEAWLGQVLENTSAAVGGAVDSYLKGTASPSQFVSTLKGAVHVGPWEELILRAGVLTRGEWLDGR